MKSSALALALLFATLTLVACGDKATAKAESSSKASAAPASSSKSTAAATSKATSTAEPKKDDSGW